MAGIYPDVPGVRFAYDTDGTLVRYKNPDTTFREITNASLINDESATANLSTDLVEFWRPGNAANGQNIQTVGVNSLGYATFVFPQLRDLTGYYAMMWTQSNNNTGQRKGLQWSADTTDGSDGSWTEVAAAWAGDVINSASTPSGVAIPQYRNTITPLALTGVKGIRFGMSRDNTTYSGADAHGFAILHLYGQITGALPGLQFWHPTLDQRLGGAALDFGDLPQGQVAIKTFRVKNHNALAASNVAVSAAANNLSPAGMAQGTQFSLDGTTYAATVTIPTIAAGGVSPLVSMRRTVGPTELSTLRVARVTAVAAAFA